MGAQEVFRELRKRTHALRFKLFHLQEIRQELLWVVFHTHPVDDILFRRWCCNVDGTYRDCVESNLFGKWFWIVQQRRKASLGAPGIDQVALNGPLSREGTVLTQFFALFAVTSNVPRFVLLTKPAVLLVDVVRNVSLRHYFITHQAHHALGITKNGFREVRILRQTFPPQSGRESNERGFEGFSSERNARGRTGNKSP